MTVRIDGASRVRPGARRRRPLLAVAAGVALLAVAGVQACRSEPPPDVGAATVAALASTAPTAAAAASTAPTVAPVAVQDGALPTADRVEAPAGLLIPAMKLDATVDAVGVDPATGDFDVPPSVDRVGWYRYGPGLEATAGSIVIAGHVDSAAQGKGAFFGLDRLAPGDKISLTDRAGTVHPFQVVGRERYAKTRIPLEKYFDLAGATRLTLITCGGPFDAKTGHYRDNIVVTATPTGR
ncbi:class F sortase [Micromonosporaceae bacterium Da 78-11]